MFAIEEEGDVKRLRAYHWASFGHFNEGRAIELPVSRAAGFTATALARPNNVHLVYIDLAKAQYASLLLIISSKTSEFAFRSQRSSRPTSSRLAPEHNCLLDCHAEIWTKYPVLPTIPREDASVRRVANSLTFVTDRDAKKYRRYFQSMISTFKAKSQKPAGRVLDDIRINTDAFARVFASNSTTSEFRAGGWFVNLLCLIPIQIAVARDNRFIPLTDGVLMQDVERELLGAEVNTIVDRLSLGWYESIFQSYMSTKVSRVAFMMAAC